MARPNKILSSPHFDKIIGWLKDGKGDTEIITLLKKQNPPQTIGRTTLYNFRKNEFDVRKKTLEEYNKRIAEAELDETVKERVNEIETLDEIIALGKEIDISDVNTLEPVQNFLSRDEIIKLKIKVLELVIKAAKAKNDITKKEEPQPVNVNVNINNRRERLKRIEAQYDSNSDTDNGTDKPESTSDNQTEA